MSKKNGGTMRVMGLSLVCALLLMMYGVSALAQTETSNPISRPIEQCIRDNAPAVEQAISGLSDAVNFLVGDLCAKPIADEQMQQQRERWRGIRERMQKQCAQRKTKPQPGLDANGEEDPCFDMDDVFDFTGGGASLFGTTYTKPPAAASLAAKILLDLRTARMNATHAQGSR